MDSQDFQDVQEVAIHSAWENPAPYASRFLLDDEARAWAAKQKQQEVAQVFGREQQAFEEAVNFVLNPETEHPYVVLLDPANDALQEAPLALTVGKIEGDLAYRDWRIVRPELQKQGMGQAMHDYEIQALPSQGVITVYTESYTNAGKNFIEKQGYHPAGEGWYYLDLKKAA